MQTPDSNTLTAAYQNDTLKDGWYYFYLGGHHIGYFTSAATAAKNAKKNNLLYVKGNPTIYTGTQLFVGRLKLLTVLAPVPPFKQIYKEDKTHDAA